MGKIGPDLSKISLVDQFGQFVRKVSKSALEFSGKFSIMSYTNQYSWQLL